MPLAVSCQPFRGHVRVRATCWIDGPADCSSPSTGEMLRVTRAPDSHCWVLTALHQCRKAASRSWWGQAESLGRNLWAPGCCKPQFPSQDSTIEPESRTFSVVPVLGQSCTYLLGYLCVHEWLNSKNLSQKSVSFGQVRTSGNPGLWKLSAATEMWVLCVPTCMYDQSSPDIVHVGKTWVTSGFVFPSHFYRICHAYLSRRVAPAHL